MKILLITRSQTIVLPMISDGGFEAIGTTIDNEALTQMQSVSIDAVVIGGGV